MKVMLGIPTGEFGRRADFYDYFNALEKPEGTVIMSSHGQSPAKNRNLIIEQALKNDCTHVLFIDDDMAFEPDAMIRILKHADKDVVFGLYLLRNFPHYPVIFDEKHDDGRCKFMFLKPEMEGVIEVINGGTGFVLIKTDVFRTLEKPWIRLGEIVSDEWCDDVGFFNRVKAAGFHLYCDLSIRLGHMMNVTLWPVKKLDGWYSSYVTGTGDTIDFSQRTEL